MGETHLVTGASGFIALQLTKQLLEAGHSVHATVRSLHNEQKVAPLKTLQAAHPDKLALFEADLLRPGSFGPAMAGCSVVHHVASPFWAPEKIRDGQKEMVEPALEGTRNVLASVNETESVKRVVMTSTIGAIAGDYSDLMGMKDHILSEAYWNESSTVKHNPYHYSKVVAEREAWKMCEAQERWSLVTICAGLVLGPCLAPASNSGSLFILDELLSGWMFYGVPDLSFIPVDVREVATAHIRAAERPGAHGRYVVSRGQMISFLDISRIFRNVHRSPLWLPSWQLPTFIVRIVGPLFGLSQKWMSSNLGFRFVIDNRRSVEELGISYRPVEETLEDHYRSWLAFKKEK
ncbi:Cinnamyl-alcohol dehydrogenase [Pleurostoma richardsiae]|uniref:Cinnamyl-alcohol dehydrogenase n=1 Tax=Pleurostoma richardsiae TaxID=41990 RepID=A0AA38RHL3_9PEZI|nr:Cinnamyl-alcohol dehydrogenase [Pleurostoma richardsiae]